MCSTAAFARLGGELWNLRTGNKQWAHSSVVSVIISIWPAALLCGRWWLRLGLLIAAQLVFFAIHAAHMLRYPYPLDYGEGPLLAQVDLLRAGMPVWQLYADPDRAPYAVVNYPPVYHLATLLVALPLGDALLAGRLISLAAALAAVGALWLLADDRRPTTDDRRAGFSAFVFRLSSFVCWSSWPSWRCRSCASGRW